MAYTGHEIGRGSVAKNDYKKTEKDPDFKGTINIDGKHHYLSGWNGMFKDGGKKLNLSLGKVVEEEEEAPAKKPATSAEDFWGE
jgi:hypothetical protein